MVVGEFFVLAGVSVTHSSFLFDLNSEGARGYGGPTESQSSHNPLKDPSINQLPYPSPLP